MRLAFLSTALPFCLAISAAEAPASSAYKCPQVSSSARNQALHAQARKGERRAAYCLALHLRSLDGGELEDTLVALGQYGDRRPIGLLLLAYHGTLSRRSLADAVSMLPLSLSDDMKAQLTALEARRNRFRRVDEPKVVLERHLALRGINAAVAEIRGHLPRR